MKRTRRQEQAKELRDRWRADPALFAREALGVRLWGRQIEIVRAVPKHRRVAVRSGHKVGKSTSAVVIALWFVCLFPRARVVITSASGRQVRSVLWKELRRVYKNARIPIGGTLHLVPDAGLQFDDGREVVGFATDEPEKMAGTSSPNLLYLVDEASGVPEEIFEAIEGNRAGGARLVMFSNPTQTAGTFFEAFHIKSEFWHPIHISSEEAAAVSPPIPGLATREWIDEKVREWGRESLLYRVRARGDFPLQGDNSVIALIDVEAAKERWDETKPDGVLHIGVDVARFGDDESVIWPVRGFYAFEPIVAQGQDTVAIAGLVMQVARNLRKGDEKPVVKVDVIGVGAGVADQLRQFGSEIVLVEVNVASAATVKGYPLLRDQIWFGLGAWLHAGGAIPADSKLDGELLAPKYRFDLQGRQKVESKDEMKKRIRRSPDRADALGLGVFPPPPPGYVGAVDDNWMDDR